VPRAALHRERLGLRLAGSAVLLVACACAGVAAQSPSPQAKPPVKDYALIYGTVWSANDTPAAGIPVTIRRTDDKKPKWQLVSDSRGEFAQRVPPGMQDYIIEANIKVPKGQPKPHVTVHIDNNERQDIGLHLPATDQGKK
jgi:hypothetical protein